MSSDLEVRIKLAPNIHRKWSNAATVRGLSLKGFISSEISRELIRTGELNPATESGVSADTAPTPAKPAKPARKVDYGPYNPSMFGPPADDDDEDEDWGDMTPPKKANRPPTYDYDYDDKLLISKNTKPMPPLTDGESIEEILNAWNDVEDEDD